MPALLIKIYISDFLLYPFNCGSDRSRRDDVGFDGNYGTGGFGEGGESPAEDIDV
jgi:hypothetical protein